MEEKDNKLSLRVKRYFRNLLRALFGMDPYRRELDELNEKYEKTAANVARLSEYAHDLESMTESRGHDIEDLTKKLAESNRMLVGGQQLIENLRRRLAEKQDELEQQAADYRNRIAQYTKEIDALKAARPVKTNRRKGNGRRTGNKDAKAEA